MPQHRLLDTGTTCAFASLVPTEATNDLRIQVFESGDLVGTLTLPQVVDQNSDTPYPLGVRFTFDVWVGNETLSE